VVGLEEGSPAWRE